MFKYICLDNNVSISSASNEYIPSKVNLIHDLKSLEIDDIKLNDFKIKLSNLGISKKEIFSKNIFSIKAPEILNKNDHKISTDIY